MVALLPRKWLTLIFRATRPVVGPSADQRRNRAELATQRDQTNKALAELKIEKARIDGDKKVAEADLGPVRYLATLIGAGDQDVLRYFILVVALLLDPAALLLLLAAAVRR